jgi:hypothetical protein
MNFPSIVFQIAACNDVNFLTCVFWIFYVSKVSITSSSLLHVWSTNIYKNIIDNIFYFINGCLRKSKETLKVPLYIWQEEICETFALFCKHKSIMFVVYSSSTTHIKHVLCLFNVLTRKRRGNFYLLMQYFLNFLWRNIVKCPQREHNECAINPASESSI